MMNLETVRADGSQAIDSEDTEVLRQKIQALEQEKMLLYRALMELAQAAEVIGNHAQRIVASLGIKVQQVQ